MFNGRPRVLKLGMTDYEQILPVNLFPYFPVYIQLSCLHDAGACEPEKNQQLYAPSGLLHSYHTRVVCSQERLVFHEFFSEREHVS